MMKRLFMILISFVLCLSLLSGCGKTEEQNQNSDNNQISNDSELKEDVENLPSDVTLENEDNKNEPDNPEVVPYTTRVKAPFNIFDKPGYDYNLVDTVWEKGLFTIVEEKNDEEGNLLFIEQYEDEYGCLTVKYKEDASRFMGIEGKLVKNKKMRILQYCDLPQGYNESEGTFPDSKDPEEEAKKNSFMGKLKGLFKKK